MLIDFHSHIFPDKIAAGAVKALSDNILEQRGVRFEHYTDGTLGGIRQSMARNGVDITVIMPIATKPKQTPSINAFAKSIMSRDVVSFGSLHPEQDDWEQVLIQLKNDGFKGVKLHPEYQSFYIDSERSVEILKKAYELGLYVTIHCGYDYGMAPPVHCQPDRLKRVLGYVPGDKIIAAHLGAFDNWDEVEKHLVGTPLLFDTAFISPFIKPEQCKRIIENHGADKVLFGSDSPWQEPSRERDFILSLGFDDVVNDKIFYKNALKILGRDFLQSSES